MSSRRTTIQRQLVLNAVKELDIHATAEQVYAHIIKQHPNIGRATVYRNLHQLVEAGEITDIGNFYGSTHYDHNNHKHYHFICANCKKIFDVEGDLSYVCDNIKQSEGFDITDINISFSGLCWECKKIHQIGD